jgi:hypothetical protein
MTQTSESLSTNLRCGGTFQQFSILRRHQHGVMTMTLSGVASCLYRRKVASVPPEIEHGCEMVSQRLTQAREVPAVTDVQHLIVIVTDSTDQSV